MKKAIVAKKIGMTQVFTEKGTLIPVTVLEAGPCVVIQKKTMETDGYQAVKVGFGDVKEKSMNKPTKGQYDKNGLPLKKVMKELTLDDVDGYNVGDEILANMFAAGDRVDVSGVSKGKGFQGSIRRHGQHRGPMSHGSKYHRGVGGMSAATSPGRVRKGRPLPGHMGHENVTVQNLLVVEADPERNLLLIKGGLPGPDGSIVVVKSTVKQ